MTTAPPIAARPTGATRGTRTPAAHTSAAGATNVRLLYTRYPHLGAHAGMIQLARFLDPKRVRVRAIPVSDSDDDFPLRSDAIRARLHARIARRGVAWYKLSDLYAEWRSLGAAVTRRADIVHYLDGEHSLSLLPGLLRRLRVGGGLAGTRTVATFHQPAPMLDALLNPRIVAGLDLVTVVAPSQAEWFRARVPDVPVEIVLHGVDTEFFSPDRSRDVQRDGERARPLRCVTAGHWLRDWDSVRAVAERLAGDPGFEFHVVTSRTTGLEGMPNVVFHRAISDVALRDVYRNADVLFLPLTDSTANNTLLEGIACGLPVVSTAVAGVQAYLPGNEAILVERNNGLVDRLIDALRQLRQDAGARAVMGQQARARAEALAWPLVAQRFEDIYARVCG